jgi:muconolactone delta-isomerase
MLFHVTMTHTPENCPVELPPSEQKKFFAKLEKMQQVAKKTKINIHFMVTGVGHTIYALIEADNFDAINLFFSVMGFKQDYQIEPVGRVQDIITAFKAGLVKKW